MAEITAWAKDQGKTLYELLQDIYLQYGYSMEKMKYVVRPGKTGADEIHRMMVSFRTSPPRMLGNSRLKTVKDYSNLTEKNLLTGETKPILQKNTSDVLQFSRGGTKIGTPQRNEPKIILF